MHRPYDARRTGRIEDAGPKYRRFPGEVAWRTCIRGLSPDAELVLHQPPAGQTEVMVRPVAAFQQALVAAGWSFADAARQAAIEVFAAESVLPVERPPWLLNFHSEAYLFVPMSHVTSRLRALGPREARIADFLDRCAETTAGTPKFIYGPFGQEPRSLLDLPVMPPQEALTEFFCGLQWNLAWELCTDGETPDSAKMQEWREGRRAQVQELERRLGFQLYHYAADGDEFDDDYVHRNLCLDYFCHMLPDSPFVSFLIEATGARGLAELRAALLSPEAYTVPFALYYLGSSEATVAEPFVWVPPIEQHRVLGIAVGGPRAASAAASLLFPHQGGRVVIAYSNVEVYNRINAGVPTTWFDATGQGPRDLPGQIEASGVLKDIADSREEAQTAPRTLKRIRLSPEWGSSGIWVVEDLAGCDGAGMLHHDELDMPFSLIGDLVRWHDRFNNLSPYEDQDPPGGFWEVFEEEQKALEIRLAEALGRDVQVE